MKKVEALFTLYKGLSETEQQQFSSHLAINKAGKDFVKSMADLRESVKSFNDKINQSGLIQQAKNKNLYEAIFDKGLRSFDQVINLYDLTDNDPLYRFGEGDLYVTFAHQGGYRHVKLYDGKEWAKPIRKPIFIKKNECSKIWDYMPVHFSPKRAMDVKIPINGHDINVELPVGATIQVNGDFFSVKVPINNLP